MVFQLGAIGLLTMAEAWRSSRNEDDGSIAERIESGGQFSTGGPVGRILKGEKPADLPVLQPTKFELFPPSGRGNASRRYGCKRSPIQIDRHRSSGGENAKTPAGSRSFERTGRSSGRRQSPRRRRPRTPRKRARTKNKLRPQIYGLDALVGNDGQPKPAFAFSCG